ncbi:unnamed protein product [Rhizophagus irregularis]|nr:unnamed protein product [Rhizophagus irregularis]
MLQNFFLKKFQLLDTWSLLDFIFRFLGFVRFWVLVYGLLMGFSFSFWTLDRFQLPIVFGIQGSELFEVY